MKYLYLYLYLWCFFLADELVVNIFRIPRLSIEKRRKKSEGSGGKWGAHALGVVTWCVFWVSELSFMWHECYVWRRSFDDKRYDNDGGWHETRRLASPKMKTEKEYESDALNDKM